MATMDLYYPFDAGAGANASEDAWRKWMTHVLATGVIGQLANELVVTESAAPAMSVKVGTGAAWIEGHYGETTAAQTIPIAAAHATLARKDLVIARADFANNRIELDVLTGTAAASPAIPSLTQNTSVWEIPLAVVDVPALDTSITNSQITDLRQWTGNPRGIIAYAEVTANQGSITTVTDLTGLSVTFWAVGNRRYRISAEGLAASTIASDLIVGYITDGSNNQLQRWFQGLSPSSSVAAQGRGETIETPSAGMVTYKLRMERNTGSGTVTLNAASTYPAFISVEDMGPA